MNPIEFLNSKFLVGAIVIIPLLITLVKKRKYFLKLFFPVECLTIFLVQIIKKFTARPRPFFHQPQVLGVVSNIPQDYSFPSMHTAVATIFAWVLYFIYPKFSWLWFGVLTIIAISRIELGLHYARDVSAGFILATFIFWIVYLLTKSKESLSQSHQINIRRKLVHLFYGLILVFLLNQKLASTLQFGCWLIFSFLLVIASPFLPTFLRNIINYFERKKSKKFLAVGPFLFTLSSFFAWIIFPKNIALSAILNLTIGDSINVLSGIFKNKKRERKTGAAVAATLATAIISLQYVSFWPAAIGAVTTGLFEFSEPKIRGKKIDDNLLIPLISGVTILLVTKF